MQRRTLPSGIESFDGIAGGGLPRGRATVILGGAGAGKTLFALQVSSARASAGEASLFVTFEESPERVLENAASFSFRAAPPSGIEFVDARLSSSVIDGGDFDFAGLLGSIGTRAEQLGAEIVVFDGLDVLLDVLGSESSIRKELFRLRAWIEESGRTAIITLKAKGDARPIDGLALLEFLADCVVLLDHRVVQGTAQRALRVTKYRGSAHTSSEIAFTITPFGIELANAFGRAVSGTVSNERVSSGVERLDAMLGGGYLRGSSVLISGAPGTAKTSLAAAFARAAAERGEPTLYISFDELPAEVVRNVASIGLDLAPHVASGVLRLCSPESRALGPADYVAWISRLMRAGGVQAMVLDPLSVLTRGGDRLRAEQTATTLLDLAKSFGITIVSSSLIGDALPLSEETLVGVSTLADTWMHLGYVAAAGERNRSLTIIKSRGTAHSNQVRELILSQSGITLSDVYAAGGEVLMGTLRWEKENELRRTLETLERSAALREQEAQLALEEARAHVEASVRERILREAELARLQSERRSELSILRGESVEVRRLRHVDGLVPERPKAR